MAKKVKTKISAHIEIVGKKINIYSIGILFWLLIWGLIFHRVCNYYGWRLFYLAYLLPVIGGMFVLWRNYDIWQHAIEIEEYPREVCLIEFVERNANYVILGITALFIASELIFRDKVVDLTGFYSFQIFSLIFSIGFVLPLLWKPHKDGDSSSLVILRHWKTVWYTYSIYFFLSATLALMFSFLRMK